MATIHNCDLTLITENDQVTVRVRYTLNFTRLEYHLWQNGLKFREWVRVLGVDEPNGEVLYEWPIEYLNVMETNAMERFLLRTKEVTLPRDMLQEDADLGDNDEIRCAVQIEPMGIPTTLFGFSNTKTLVG